MRSDALPYTCLSFRAQAAPSVRGRTRKAAQAATAVQNPTPMMVEIPAAGPNFGMSPPIIVNHPVNASVFSSLQHGSQPNKVSTGLSRAYQCGASYVLKLTKSDNHATSSTHSTSSDAVLKRLASCLMVFCSCVTCAAQRPLNSSRLQPASSSSSSVCQRASVSPRSSS